MAVAFDAISTATAGNLPSFAHTCSGSNRLLLVGVTDWNVNPLSGYGTGCTYNGVAMTVLSAFTTTPAGFRWFYLVNPASGSNTVTVTGSSGAAPMAVALSFANVHQVSPFVVAPDPPFSGNVYVANGSGSPATINVDSGAGVSAGNLVACVVSYFGGNTSVTVGAGQSHESKGNIGNTGISMSVESGAGGTVTMSESWTSVGSDNWAIGAVEIRSAAIDQAVSGGITPTGAITSRSLSRTLAGGITPTSTLVRALSRALDGGITPTGALAKSLARTLSGAITPVGALVKSLARLLQGGITPTGALDIREPIVVDLEASVVRTVRLEASCVRTLSLEGSA